LLCFGLRFLAIRRQWHLPIATEEKLVSTDEGKKL